MSAPDERNFLLAGLLAVGPPDASRTGKFIVIEEDPCFACRNGPCSIYSEMPVPRASGILSLERPGEVANSGGRSSWWPRLENDFLLDTGRNGHATFVVGVRRNEANGAGRPVHRTECPNACDYLARVGWRDGRFCELGLDSRGR